MRTSRDEHEDLTAGASQPPSRCWICTGTSTTSARMLVQEGYWPILGHEKSEDVARAVPDKARRAKRMALDLLYQRIAPSMKMSRRGSSDWMSDALRLVNRIEASKKFKMITKAVQDNLLDITPNLLKTKMKDLPLLNPVDLEIRVLGYYEVEAENPDGWPTPSPF